MIGYQIPAHCSYWKIILIVFYWSSLCYCSDQGFGPEARVHCGQITWEHSLRLATTTRQAQSVPFQANLGESLFMAAPTAAQVQQVPKAFKPVSHHLFEYLGA